MIFETEKERFAPIVRHLRILKFINSLTLYCLVRNIQKARIFRASFWGLINLALGVGNLRLSREISKTLTRMEIHEDGQFVDLYFLNGSKRLNLDISGFEKLSPEDLE